MSIRHNPRFSRRDWPKTAAAVAEREGQAPFLRRLLVATVWLVFPPILTGNQHPSTVVLNRARKVGVPIVVVEPDTLTTVRTVEQIFGRTFLRQARKSAHFVNILEERFDFVRFYDMLGLET